MLSLSPPTRHALQTFLVTVASSPFPTPNSSVLSRPSLLPPATSPIVTVEVERWSQYVKQTEWRSIFPKSLLESVVGEDILALWTLFDSSHAEVKVPQSSSIGIFWDLENKPPNSVSPFEAAIRLKRAVSSFGVVRHLVAYANRHAFSYVPPAIRDRRMERKVLNHLENNGVIKRVDPYLCRVCGRKFTTNEKLINHFEIHEREHQKRMNKIESAKGRKRVNLVGKYAMKMEKYENAARDIVTPKVGYGLAEDLKRAGFWVKTVSDKPQAADIALRNHMVDMMDHKRIKCAVLVSDDSDFLVVLKEARERCVKTVVVGDNDDGVLKRNADASFSWREVLIGKAKKEAGSVVSRWKDRDILKRLEWSYNPEEEKDSYSGIGDDDSDFEDFQSEDEQLEHSSEDDDVSLGRKNDRPWWELDSDDKRASSNPRTRL